MTPLATLKKYWGHATFRPLQQDIIQAVLDNKDVLALLPTGGGKSICFQIPALMRPGLCLVVSPLIALMKDQVDQLKQKGIAAEAVFSGMPPREVDLVLDNCIYGQVKLLYISPERLKTELLQERVKRMQVNLLAVDEAHCISQWGYDFRPAYLEIALLRQLLPQINTIALTATATPKVQQDIQAKLQFRHTAHFQKSFARNNLAYVVRKTEDKQQQLLNILHQVPGTAIVYVNTRKKAQTVAQLLQKNRIKAADYHAGLPTPTRAARQEAWVQGSTRVIVGTNAFGMGIDKPNVSAVIHLDLPATLEAYYQEAGRAGRNEKKAYAVVLYDDHDLTLLREQVQRMHPTLAQLKQVYQHLANYYQVAVGSHAMTTYDFDLEAFAHTYGLQLRAAYNALKALEGQGLLQLNEAFFQPAQVHIVTAPKAMYAFQVAHAAYDPLIKVLLRLYGGELFAGFGSISVQRVASLLQTTPQQVNKQLQALDRLAVLQYQPQKDQPQLTFTTARHPADKLPLDERARQQKAKTATDRAEAVIRYVTHQHRCRAQLLLTYFGEEPDQACGQCDICLGKTGKNRSEAAHPTHRHLVLQCLQAGPCTLKQVVTRIDLDAAALILATIRQMLDQGEVAYDQAGRLVLKPAAS